MELEVFWTQFTEEKLHEIFKYYRDKAGYRIAKKLSDGIFNEPFKLIKHPEIGQVEPYLVDLEVDFRYLLYKKVLRLFIGSTGITSGLRLMMFLTFDNIR